MKIVKIIILLSVFIFGAYSETSLAQSSSYNGVTFWFKLTNSTAEESKTSFRVGEEIVIRTSLENYSYMPFPFPATDENYLFKFRLTKVGEILPVAYRDDKAQILTLREETKGAGMFSVLDPILPGDTQELEIMKLGDRYENLTPGSYQLTLEYKTHQVVESDGKAKMLRLANEVSFDIVP